MIRPAILSTIFATLSIAGSVLGEAKLSIPQTDFAYGFVPQNAKISHRFVLKSTGTDTLKIDKIAPSCGCTQAPLPKTAIAPGDSTEAELIFNTGSYKGTVVKQATVMTTPADSTQRLLHFTANVVAKPDSTFPLVISPYKVSLEMTGKTEREFTLTNASDKPLHPTLVDVGAAFEVKLPGSIGAGKSAKGKVVLAKGGPDAPFEQSFTMQLDDSASTRFTVPVLRETAPTAAVPASAPGK